MLDHNLIKHLEDHAPFVMALIMLENVLIGPILVINTQRAMESARASVTTSNYMAEYEEYTNFFTSKGKGKGKKGKNAHWLDAQLWSKAKSKGKNKSSSAAPRPSVNAYMFTGGMEMLDFKELNSASCVSKMKDEQGLIDCGATASAGPLVAVESLIGSVLAKDRQANIEAQQSARPYFRFGNGQWGRALYRVVITSNVSASPQQFKLFALPNPPELHHPGFDKSTLVPILVGMDHLGGDTGMTIDFPMVWQWIPSRLTFKRTNFPPIRRVTISWTLWNISLGEMKVLKAMHPSTSPLMSCQRLPTCTLLSFIQLSTMTFQ